MMVKLVVNHRRSPDWKDWKTRRKLIDASERGNGRWPWTSRAAQTLVHVHVRGRVYGRAR